MPEIKLQHVVSFSSEEKNNPADNLLKPEGTHKWKSATPGEKSVSVVIQFEKASQIHRVDIGNEGSAFVEILVGRSTAATDHDYQVLLVASSFMTPLEARNGSNRTSVRMFDASKFSAAVSSQKWDRVKIVCTQPFNKTSTYGLSFVKFHSPSVGGEKGGGEGEKKALGFFKIKADDKDDVKTGSLFSHRGKPETSTPSTPLSGAAAMRAASRLADQSKPSTSTPVPSSSSSSTPAKESPKMPKETDSKKTQEKKVPTPGQNREKRKHNVSDDEDGADDGDVKPTLRKQSTSISSVVSSASSKSSKPPPLKKTKSEPPKDSPVKEFRRLMENVVFVLSGFQNPFRGELRDRAMSMGATYKSDWGKGCTHLICAFVNTPKYNQVKGRGKIVDKKWIGDCYKQKKLLPWRQYRLGDADSPDEDSEEEVISAKPKTEKKEKKTPKKEEMEPVVDVGDSDEDVYRGNTDSGADTEDEIRKIKQQVERKKKKKASPGKSPKKTAGDDVDPYAVDTDEDEKPGPSTSGGANDSGDDSGLPELPDFFAGKHFFIYGDMEATQRRLMTRYITAYAGELEDYMSDKIKYVVTSSKWDKNFDDALSDNPNLVFVKPKWVQICHEKVKCVPHQPYIVVPPDE